MEKSSKKSYNAITSTSTETRFQKAKESIYNTIYYILKDQQISKYLIIVLNIIETLQLLSYSFHSKFGEAWKVSGYEDLFDMISKFFDIFRVSYYVQRTDEVIFLATFYVIIVLIVLFFVIFWVLATKETTDAETNFAYYYFKALGSYSIYLNTILLIPFIEIILINFDCENLKKLKTTCFAEPKFLQIIFVSKQNKKIVIDITINSIKPIIEKLA